MSSIHCVHSGKMADWSYWWVWGFRTVGWGGPQQFPLFLVNFHWCKRVPLSVAQKPDWQITSDPCIRESEEPIRSH